MISSNLLYEINLQKKFVQINRSEIIQLSFVQELKNAAEDSASASGSLMMDFMRDDFKMIQSHPSQNTCQQAHWPKRRGGFY